MPEVPRQHVKAVTPLVSPILCRIRHFSLRHSTVCRNASLVKQQEPRAVRMQEEAQRNAGMGC